MRRKVKGTSLVLVGEGERYITEDGRYEVAYQGDYYTYCEEPHPVRLPMNKWHMGYDARGKYREIRGYQCPGNEEHTYGRWHVWDNNFRRMPNGEFHGDYAFGDAPGTYGSFNDAARELARQLGKIDITKDCRNGCDC